AHRNFEFLKGILETKAVHDGCQHAHVVRRYAIHILRSGGHSTEEVPATYHHTYVDSLPPNGLDLGGKFGNTLRIQSELLRTSESFAAKFEQDPLIGCHDVLISSSVMGACLSE